MRRAAVPAKILRDPSKEPVNPPEEPEKTYALTLAEDALSLLEGDTGVEVAIGSFTVDGAAAKVLTQFIERLM